MTPLLKTKTRRYFSILRRVTLISNFLEFYKAGSTTSRYVAMEIKTHFKFSRGQDNKNWELVLGLVMDFLIDGQISSFCPDQSEAEG